MKKKYDVNDLINKLLELYNIYESYVWNHEKDDLKIYVFFKELNYKIDLFKDDKQVDSFEMKFTEKEKKLYNYIATRIFVYLFNNVKIQKDNSNKFYNNKHKPYLSLYVEDKKLLEELRAISVLLNGYNVDDVNNILDTKYKNLKKYKKIDKQTIALTNDRLVISKRLIRSDKNE